MTYMPVEVFALNREREYRLWGLFVTSVYQFCLGTEKNYTYSAPKTRIMKCCDIRVMFNIMMFIALLNFLHSLLDFIQIGTSLYQFC